MEQKEPEQVVEFGYDDDGHCYWQLLLSLLLLLFELASARIVPSLGCTRVTFRLLGAGVEQQTANVFSLPNWPLGNPLKGRISARFEFQLRRLAPLSWDGAHLTTTKPAGAGERHHQARARHALPSAFTTARRPGVRVRARSSSCARPDKPLIGARDREESERARGRQNVSETETDRQTESES